MSWDEDEATRIEDVRCIRQTPKALLCHVPDAFEEGGYREVWIPQSQILADSEVYKEGDEGTLVVTAWIAREKDLVDD